MISLTGVSKRYGAALAVQDLNFTVRKGEVLGLLGQNGAGKTTTLNMLTGYLAPSSGEITVDGENLFDHPRLVKQKIGYLPELPPLYDEMTVESYLRFACELRLVVSADIPAHIRGIAEKINLTDVLGRRIGNLSKGYRQRVGLAQALCGNPEVLVLDEPTVGLDPRQTAEFRAIIHSLQGKHTILFSSHILSEVQSLCDRVIILHHGRIVCDQTLGNLRSGDNIRLNLSVLGDTELLLPALRSLPSVEKVTRLPSHEVGIGHFMLECRSGTVPQKEIFTLLSGLNSPIMGLQIAENTLEEIFLRCTADG